MREMFFRGKKIKNKEWTFGYLIKSTTRQTFLTLGFNTAEIELKFNLKTDNVLSSYFEEVIPETVGQYVGIVDKHYKRICEGDILRNIDGNILEVVWKDNGFKAKYTFTRKYQGEEYTETKYLELVEKNLYDRYKYEIIGNIYDDPELITRWW